MNMAMSDQTGTVVGTSANRAPTVDMANTKVVSSRMAALILSNNNFTWALSGCAFYGETCQHCVNFTLRQGVINVLIQHLGEYNHIG
jgi:hypothetical protein